MAIPSPPAAVHPVLQPQLAQEGVRRLRAASYVGLIGQVLLWGSVITLAILGSLLSGIPVSTKLAYGVNGVSVPALGVFALNVLLLSGAVILQISFVIAARSFPKFSAAGPAVKLGGELSLSFLGAAGPGLIALGWAVWLGSFVPPGVGPNTDPLSYQPVLGANLLAFVDFMLFAGGLLAFLGFVGIAVASSKIGTAYEEGFVELGGALSALPLFSFIGYGLLAIGLNRVEHKIGRGWTPPPPAPPPVSHPVYVYPGGWSYGPPPPPLSSPQGPWDSLATVLVVLLVVLWAVILPFSLIASNGLTKGPGGPPLGGPNGSSPPTSSGPISPLPVVVILLAATAIVLPIAISRNRRKRLRTNPPPAPPPPPTPPPPTREEDPLDHLV